jgi:hypothetical protein
MNSTEERGEMNSRTEVVPTYATLPLFALLNMLWKSDDAEKDADSRP